MTKQFVHPEYPHSETTAKIIKAAKMVHRGIGPGFEEVIYQRALALEFAAQGLDFSRVKYGWMFTIGVRRSDASE